VTSPTGAALAPRFLIVNRTEADPRYVDLCLDPNDRPYGSLHGPYPHLINYGTVGFGRICSPDAWLSTWSGLSTNASFAKAAPHVTVPTLSLEFSGDQTLLPADADKLYDAIGAPEKERGTCSPTRTAPDRRPPRRIACSRWGPGEP
jgi:hypothetical protein